MAFPDTPTDALVELQVDGVFTDITDDVYPDDAITIGCGRPNEAAQIERSRAGLTLYNTSLAYSPRNPNSPNYGKIGRNTPLRVSVLTGDPYGYLPGADGSYFSAPDAAALGITGDIDVRIEFATNGFPGDYLLASKYNTAGDQRSWALFALSNGLLNFRWSTDGTFAGLHNIASTTTPVWGPGRTAFRVTLDVDNGASGHTVTFYTSDSITGTWTQLGDPVVTSGTTSVFDSSAPVELGYNAGIQPAFAFDGRLYAFELRSGIAGTVVANPDFTAQAVGATSFADTASSPNTWIAAGDAAISNRIPRVCGEVPSWPPRWDPSRDRIVSIEGYGILRRLGKGSPALRSAMTRGFSDPTRTAIVEYWPCEDAQDATRVASAFPGHSAGVAGGQPDFAAFSDFVGSDALPTLEAGSLNFAVGPYTVTGETSLRVFVHLPSGGTGATNRIVSMRTSGTAARWEVEVSSAGSQYQLRAYDSTNTSILATGFTSFFSSSEQKILNLELTQDGADVDYNLTWIGVSVASLEVAPTVGATSGTLAGRTVNRVTTINVAPSGALGEGAAAGHVALANDISAFASTEGPIVGWAGEQAGDRLARLCAEEGITLVRFGVADTVRMGVQKPLKLLALLQECVDSDGGIMFEPRDRIGLGYRDKSTLYNQIPQIELDHDTLTVPLAPVEDDQQLHNDVTVTRDGGSSFRVALESGAMSVQPPPDGVGLYDDAVTQSLRLDAQLVDAANWRLHLGTVDEPRFPGFSLDLAAIADDQDLAERALRPEQGDRLAIGNPPDWLPPDQISQLVQGYSETLRQESHTIAFNLSPESPYRVAVVNDAVLGHAGTAGSELASGVTSSATTLPVATTSGPIWTLDADSFPFDIAVGGERMTVTNPAAGLTDTFTRSVSNGWGTSDSGDVWSTSGPAASDFSVNGSSGLVSLGSVNVRRFTFAAVGDDVVILDSVTVPVTATGGSISGGYVARYADDSNFYLYQVLHDTGGLIDLQIVKRVGGTFTTLASISDYMPYTAGVPTNVRCLCAGTTLAIKIWADGTPEPVDYAITATDTSFSSGAVGTHSNLLTGNTNALPVVVAYDDIQVSAAGISGNTSPQTFTVVRSVNGVVKAHSAGAPVRLWQPMTLAY